MTEGHTGRLEAALDGKYRIERKLGEGGMATVSCSKTQPSVKASADSRLAGLDPRVVGRISGFWNGMTDAERTVTDVRSDARA